MRTVTYGGACSLDGFLGTPDGGVDWLHFSKDVQQIMKSFWDGVDTMLMGRKTWEAVVQSARGKGGGMPGVSGYVFSRTLREITVPGVTLVTSDAGEFVRELKQQPGGKICVMGGGDLARSLFAAGVIDEVGLNVHPVLLGAGIPTFRDAGRRIHLELTETRAIDGGCVYMNYRVQSAASAGAPRRTSRSAKARKS